MEWIIVRMAVRLFFGFLILLGYMHLLGKMQLAPTAPIDQIGNYVLGGIIGGVIYNLELPFWQFIAAVVIWGVLIFLVNLLRSKNLQAKRAIDGKPVLLMENGVVHTDAFAGKTIGADDLISRLHQEGIGKLEDVRTIWMEPNGHLTVIRKDQPPLAWTLIEDGQINYTDLTIADVDESWVRQELERQGVEDMAKVFCGQMVDGKLQLYLYT